MTPKDLKKLNQANALMTKAQKLINEVYASDKDFRYGCQSTPIKNRLDGAIGQLECVDGVLKIN